MRIDQSSSFLMTLIREVSAGRMLPAAMQRPYVWRQDDVEALMESVLSGFPLGSFLLWAPGAKAGITKLAKGRLGPLRAAKAGDVTLASPYYLLLDGQNRLATIAWMLMREVVDVPDASDAERDTWLSDRRLVLDGASRTVKFVPATEADTGLRLPAWTLVCSSPHDANDLVRKRYNAWQQAGFADPEIDDYVRFWDQACGQFRNARTTETVLVDATAEEARHAFLRICRVGVFMSAEEFDRAVGWTPGAN